MKKKLLCLLLTLTLSLGLTAAFAFAGDGADGGTTTIQPYSTAVASFDTTRVSDTKANAYVYVLFTRQADEYTVTITLQKKSNGSWVTATDVTGNTIKYIGKNRSSVTTYDEWRVKSGALYRVKCTSTDKYDGIKYTRTNYSDPF